MPKRVSEPVRTATVISDAIVEESEFLTPVSFKAEDTLIFDPVIYNFEKNVYDIPPTYQLVGSAGQAFVTDKFEDDWMDFLELGPISEEIEGKPCNCLNFE